MDKEDLLKMDMDQQLSYWLGRMLIAIGSGSFKSELYAVMDFYLRVGYERGVAAAKEQK